MAERAENRLLRIGVHGIGDHARRTILPAVDAAPTLILAGISTRNPEVRKSEGEKWSCPGWDGLDAMLNSAELDAVIVASPIGCHFVDGLKVLTAGVHLWSEKAFTNDLADAESLIKLAGERDLAVCVSLAPAYHAQFRAIRRLLGDGVVGRPRDINAHFGFPHVARERSLYDPALGGGALLDMGYYPIVLAAELLGEVPRVRGANLAGDDGYAVDTSGAAVLTSASGVQVSAQWGYGRDYINELTIVGDTGTIVAKPAFSKPAHLAVTLSIRRQNACEDVQLESCNQFEEMLKAFAAATIDGAGRHLYRTKALEHQRLMAEVAVRSGDGI